MAASRLAFTGVLLAALLGLQGRIAMANTVQDMLGMGTRGKAMGGTGTASSSDASSVYYNPAGLGECPHNEINFQISHLVYAVDVESDDERIEQGTLNDRSNIGISGCVPLPGKLRAGFLFDTGLQGAQKLDQASLRTRPEYALYGNSLEQISMITGVGMKVNEKFSVGIGGALLVNSALGVGVEVPIVAGQEELGAELEWTLDPAAAAYAGIKYHPTRELSLGVSVRTALYHKLEADVLTTVDVAGVLLDVDLLLESVAWYSPLQASVGASYDSAMATVAADITWYHWSAHPGPYLRISPLDPDDSIAAELNYPPNEEPNFSDVFVPRIGVERPVGERMLLRGGVAYRPTPAPTPSPASRTNLLDSSVTTASFGAAYHYEGGQISLYARAHHMRERTVRKEIEGEGDLTYRFGGALFDLGLAIQSSW